MAGHPPRLAKAVFMPIIAPGFRRQSRDVGGQGRADQCDGQQEESGRARMGIKPAPATALRTNEPVNNALRMTASSPKRFASGPLKTPADDHHRAQHHPDRATWRVLK